MFGVYSFTDTHQSSRTKTRKIFARHDMRCRLGDSRSQLHFIYLLISLSITSHWQPCIGPGSRHSLYHVDNHGPAHGQNDCLRQHQFTKESAHSFCETKSTVKINSHLPRRSTSALAPSRASPQWRYRRPRAHHGRPAQRPRLSRQASRRGKQSCIRDGLRQSYTVRSK